MARNLWVQGQLLGEAIEQEELEPLLRTSYELMVARLPHSRRPWAAAVRRSAREPASRRRRARR